MILVAGIPEVTSSEFSFGEVPACSINCLTSDLLNLSTEKITSITLITGKWGEPHLWFEFLLKSVWNFCWMHLGNEEPHVNGWEKGKVSFLSGWRSWDIEAQLAAASQDGHPVTGWVCWSHRCWISSDLPAEQQKAWSLWHHKSWDHYQRGKQSSELPSSQSPFGIVARIKIIFSVLSLLFRDM